MNETFCNDWEFGPVVHNCRDGFDFTLVFENTILSIVPSSLVLLLITCRTLYLYKKPKLLVHGQKFQIYKLTALVCYAILQVALTSLWAVQPSVRSWSSALAASLALFNALAFCLISYLEHARSKRPSTVLIVYLLFSTLFDIVRCRTLWLVASGSSLGRLFTASTAFKLVILILESGEKAKYMPVVLSQGRPEETSSILNRGVFYWLNRLMVGGARRILLPRDLYELQEQMTAVPLGRLYLRNWRRTEGTTKHAAMLAAARTLKWNLFAPVFPRIALLALTVCQPILLNKLLSFLSAPVDTTSKNIGYGLIAAYALVYGGSAFATGFYWYKHYQFLTMLRGCLVSAISWRTASLNIVAVGDPKAAVTLMSADVERITEGLRSFHEFWAGILQIGFALYLLKKQIGVACVVPIIVCGLCSAGTAWTSGSLNGRQAKWMEAVQKRIGLTSAVLTSMKGVKLRGLVDVSATSIQSARSKEVGYASRWRWMLLVNVSLSFVPEYLAPVATFMVYIIQAKASKGVFDVSRAFTTVSLLTIMTQPLNALLQSVPGLVNAVGCFDRIGKFLSSEEQKDFRDLTLASRDVVQSVATFPLKSDASQGLELQTLNSQGAGETARSDPAIIQVTQGCFDWGDNKEVLKDINLTIPKGALCCIVGPVASGKSTLCQSLLGETNATKGQVEVRAKSKDIAFCHQSAYLINGTIKDNIIGLPKQAVDEDWYDTVLHACALRKDISAMPKRNDTIVGSGGVNLSGGQRHKVAMARAIYARKELLILDDVFSGLDAGSQQHVFRNVLGPAGLARKQGTTVVFATHAIKFLPYTDRIIVLSEDGRVVQEGSYDYLYSQPGYIRDLALGNRTEHQAGSDTEAAIEHSDMKGDVNTMEDEMSRQVGDFTVYRYYFKAAGTSTTLFMVAFAIGVSVFFNLPVYWLKLWSESSSGTGERDEYLYLGVYSLFQCLAFMFLNLLVYQVLIVIVGKTGLRLHSRLLQTVANASLLFFSTTDNGSITNRFSQDMQMIDMQLPTGFINVMFAISVATGQMVLVIASSPYIGLAFPIVLVLLYFVQKFYLRTSRQLRFLDLDAKGPLYTNFLETLSGLSTIRAFGWTEYNLRLNSELLDASQKPLYLLYMIQRWLTFVLDTIVSILAVLIATISVLERSSSGLAGVALTSVLSINLTLRLIIVAWTDVETSIGSVSRIKSFSENTPSEHKPHEIYKPPVEWPQSGKVEFEALSAIYETAPDELALRKIDLVIQPGEKIGICGRSGSGKSSMILALFRMLEIRSGFLRIDGVDLQTVPRNLVRERLNVIPQDTLFLPGSVRENLNSRGEWTNAALVEVLKKVRLWTVFEANGGLESDIISKDVLSHGQRQLFSLAYAILRKSKIVVLDEATSNVDHETDKFMQKLIREEFKGCTIIAVAHRLNTIMDFDRIAVLDHGVLCELDTPQALLARDSRYRSMWGERVAS